MYAQGERQDQVWITRPTSSDPEEEEEDDEDDTVFGENDADTPVAEIRDLSDLMLGHAHLMCECEWAV